MPMPSLMSAASVDIENSLCHVDDSLREERPIRSPANECKGQYDIEDKLEPIAIVGMALKFPQDATSPESFWQMMVHGQSAKTDVPPERFDINGFHGAVGTRVGQLKARGGHFIQDDIAAFDAPFFSITPNEASCMDPLQRWLLETTYKALEDAGMPIEKASGSKTSVFVGALPGDYPRMLSRDTQHDRKYRAVGTSPSILANRLSWFYRFTGPSTTIDTACSSSLVALDLACQSLRGGSSNMALVGGCNMWMDPESSIPLTDLNFLSPDSTCYSFDHRANGYARGEGVGVLLLKPLSKALEDSDTIRAVIRATGTSHNGRTPGLTQPSCEAQQNLIKDTYLAGGLDPKETMFVEAHGTGTSLGDPLEAAAIGSAFGDQSRLQPVIVGAVKTNIGHLEGASGIAGVIKTVLVLEKAVIPPNLWFEEVNPQIDVGKLKIKFPLKPIAWPTSGLRRGSVNSSGFGGANAHVVLDDAYNYLKLRNLEGRHNTRKTLPPTEFSIAAIDRCNNSTYKKDHIQPSTSENRPRLFVWSAAELDGLKKLYKAYLIHLRALSSYETDCRYFANLAWTLSEKRSRLPWKSFVVAYSIADLQQVLANTTPNGLRSNQAPKLGFVFTGQGAQWCGMGRELLEYPVFRESLCDADTFLRDIGCPWSLLSELLREEAHSRLGDAEYAQPACTALQIALVELLRSWGVTPAAVIGHSSGEIAAAYCVGGLSRGSAWKIAYYRGVVAASLVESSRNWGSMLAVGLSEADIRPYLHRIDKSGGQLTVGCINSPQNVTVSGSSILLDSLHEQLQKDKVFNRRLSVNVAYHSKQMNDIAPFYHSLIRDISSGTPLQAEAIMFSSLKGLEISAKELSNSEYWVANLVSPVRFFQALTNFTPKEALAKFGRVSYRGLRVNHVIEIGPHAALKGPIKEYIDTISQPHELTYDSVLVRGQSALSTTMTALGRLHCLGQPLDIAAVNESKESLPSRQLLLDLPSYPFNHSKKYWAEGRVSKSLRFRAVHHHELLGTQVSDWNPLNARWQNVIRVSEHPWIKDHKINGVIVYPVAGMFTMVIEAARQLHSTSLGISAYLFKQVIVQKALLVPSGDDGVETQLHLRPSNKPKDRFPSWTEFQLYAFENDAWSEICQGCMAVKCDDGDASDSEPLDAREAYQRGADRCSVECYSGSLYRFLDAHGINFGPRFRGLKEIRVNEFGEATATSNLLAWQMEEVDVDIQPHVIHPIALDAVLQTGYPALSHGGRKPISTMIPTAIPYLSLFVNKDHVSSGKSISMTGDLKVHATSKLRGFRNCEMAFTAIHAETGQPLLTGTIQSTSASGIQKSFQDEDSDSRRCFCMEWKPDLDLLDPGSIAAYCSSSSRGPMNVHNRMIEEKELLCRISLQELSDAKLPKEAMPHLQRYTDWMEHQLAKKDPADVATCATQLRRLRDDQHYLTRLYRKTEKSDSEGRLIVRVARSLLKVFTGEVDVLELLFGDSLLSEYYDNMHRQPEGFRNINPYVEALAHKQPDLKILEIGAGTGGATQQMLNLLTVDGATNSFNPRFSEYVFTDISPEFFEKAKLKYKRLENLMTFATLNIEADPIEQGFKEGIYDVVVASNVGLLGRKFKVHHTDAAAYGCKVLHATKDLKSTLYNTRKLLKSGGKLILIESTVPDQLPIGFVFGLLPGWWLGKEDNRKWGPLVGRECWHAHLSDCGFSGIDFVLPSEDKHSVPSVIVSTALRAKNTASSNPLDGAIMQGGASSILPPSIPTNVAVLVDPNSQFQSRLTRELIARMESTPALQFEAVAFPAKVATLSDQATCIFLPEMERPFLHEMTSEEHAACQHMASSAARILWVNKASEAGSDPRSAIVTGLARSLASENSGQLFVTLALEASQARTPTAEHISKVLQSMLTSAKKNVETEYKEIGGHLCINRLVNTEVLDRHIAQKTGQLGPETATLRQDPSRRLGLTMDSPGLLDTLQFSDVEVHGPLPSICLEIEVKAAGVNFRDIMIALGYDIGESLGFECSGIVTQAGSSTNFQIGDKVVCIVEGALATSVRCEAYAAAKIPDGMTFATAAAFPVAFLTAYYSIIHLARMQRGESILVHSAAGGFGQACIQTARLVGAEIYATVGNEDKKRLLTDVYGIEEDHIFSSRTPKFALEVHRMTQGRGIDVIVNSLAGEALKTSWECVAPYGRFLEVGKTDISSSKELPMSPFARGAAFIGVDLVNLRKSENTFHEVLMKTMSLINEGKYTVPTPLKTYDTSQVVSAFRYLESGKSVGKSVIILKNDDIVKIVPSRLPDYYFAENHSYVIAGGLGGIGRSIARWMVSRNAKNLILLSRTSAHSGVVQNFLNELRDKRVNVATPACDIGDQENLSSALASCKNMPAVKGCIQAAMVLKNNLFVNMSLEQFQAGVKPKIDGSWNLHRLLPTGMDFFILLSSIAGITGKAGMANYACGNTYQDALVQYRIANKEKAISLDLCQIEDVGYLAQHDKLMQSLAPRGNSTLTEAELLALLDYHCNPYLPLASRIQSQVVLGLPSISDLKAQNVNENFPLNRPIFRILRQIKAHHVSTTIAQPDSTVDFKSLIRAAETLDEAADVVADGILTKLSRLLAVEKENVDSGRTIATYGVDSLSAVEMKTWFRNIIGAEVTTLEILGNESITALSLTVAAKSRYVKTSVKESRD